MRHTGLKFKGSNEIGVFTMLTNKYCLTTDGGAESFYSVLEGELSSDIPVVRCSIAGCRFIGRVTVGLLFSLQQIPIVLLLLNVLTSSSCQ